jgi:hypothetical protein
MKLNEILQKYVIKNKYTADVNPKVVRTILWRALTNMVKHASGKTVVKDNLAVIVVAALETLATCKTDASITNACTLAVNNIVFVEVCSTC